MSPIFRSDYQTDVLLRDSKSLSDLSLADSTGGVESANLDNIRLEQRRPSYSMASRVALWMFGVSVVFSSWNCLGFRFGAMPFATRSAPLAISIIRILTICPEPQMVGIATRRIVAVMKNMERASVPEMMPPNQSVRPSASIFKHAVNAVSVLIFRAIPQTAFSNVFSVVKADNVFAIRRTNEAQKIIDPNHGCILISVMFVDFISLLTASSITALWEIPWWLDRIRSNLRHSRDRLIDVFRFVGIPKSYLTKTAFQGI